jgi:2-desacetyl-2-hydroxyethyl bacteriochlorophyllide A dehydrogenase
VLETGNQVTRVEPGDRVLGCFHTACGRCFFCLRGLFHKCDASRTFGHGAAFGDLAGSQAEQVLVPGADLTLRKVPQSMAAEVALFAGDVMGTGYHAVVDAGLTPGDSVGVLGLGPVGLCAVQAACAFGAAQVFAIDSVQARLDLAEQFGATPLHLEHSDLRKEIRSATDGRGLDIVVDAVGDPRALESAIRLTRKCGTVQAVGVYAERCEVHMGLAWIKALRLHTGHANVIGHVDAVLALMQAGRLDPSPLVTHHLPLDEAADAYALYDRREALKIVLQP